MTALPDLASAQVQRAALKVQEPIWLYDLRYAGKMASDKTKFAQAWDEVHVVSTLQGIVNRKAPRLYIRAIANPEGGNIQLDDWWLDKLQAPGAWLHKRRVETVPNLDALLTRFLGDVKGLVVYDQKVPATSNVASTIAGVQDLLAVRYDAAPDSLFNRLQKMGFPVREWLVNRDGSSLFTGKGVIPGVSLLSSGSPKNDAYRWAIRRYIETKRVAPDALGYYLDAYPVNLMSTGSGPNSDYDLWRCAVTNHDYFVSKRAFFFDLAPWSDEAASDEPSQKPGTDLETMRLLLAAMVKRNVGKSMIHVGGFTPWVLKYTEYTGAKHGAVATEWETSRILSQYNAYLDADAPGLGTMANASFYTHQPLPTYKPEKAADLSNYLAADGTVLPKRYVTYYVGDFDSAAWMYQMLPSLWSDNVRGDVPLGWAFNPNLALRFPAGFWYTRKTRSANDWFVAGDSGAGYVNPSQLEEPRESGIPSGEAIWEAHNTSWYKKFGISITGFVIDGFAPPMADSTLDFYARFSPKGVIGQKTRPQLRGTTPFLLMSNDLGGTPQEAANVIRTHANGAGAAPSFQVFRAILKSPSWYRDVTSDLHSGRGEIVVVDPYTLMELAKRQMKKK